MKPYRMLLGLVFTLAACELFGPDAEAPPPGIPDVDAVFGDAYTIVDPNPITGTPRRPTLKDGMLSFTVQHGGGCASHEFTLHYEVRGTLASVWFRHNGNGDMCEALIITDMDRNLPAPVLEARVIWLLGPGDQAYQIR